MGSIIATVAALFTFTARPAILVAPSPTFAIAIARDTPGSRPFVIDMTTDDPRAGYRYAWRGAGGWAIAVLATAPTSAKTDAMLDAFAGPGHEYWLLGAPRIPRQTARDALLYQIDHAGQ
jgi:hypothetical protein